MIELPSAQQEAEKMFPYTFDGMDPRVKQMYGEHWAPPDIMDQRRAFEKCYTELYLPERQRAEVQGKLIEKLETALKQAIRLC